jgi:FMN phosphatase YigB (HAD superfamily)
MIAFKDYIEEKTNSTLHVFDVDDTLVHSNAKVHVKNVKGNTIKKITTSEYNHYKLPANHIVYLLRLLLNSVGKQRLT